MDPLRRGSERKSGLLNLLRQRETQGFSACNLPQKVHVTENLISRLGLEAELKAHEGCVNCLEWNESGQFLISSSDDMTLCLWDPFRHDLKMQHPTGHDGNVFSIKFVPKTNDRIVVTGAGDNCVIVHDITMPGKIFHCRCHTGRVKRIATDNTPFLFWTASEDGTVMQYDLRMDHHCKTTKKDQNQVLIDLVTHVGRQAEAKCIAVSPTKSELIAVGANDPYVRLYDRRMIRLTQRPETISSSDDWAGAGTDSANKAHSDDNVPLGCVQYFIPGHLRSRAKGNIKIYATTYVTFSGDGSELLVNMGSEQIYLFDIDRDKGYRTFQHNPELPGTSLEYLGYSPEDILTERIFGHRYYSPNMSKEMSDGEVKKSAYGFNMNSCDLSSLNVDELPDNIEAMKQEANTKFQDNQFAYAISIYNKALRVCPTAAILYANRAAAFMKRRWDGDIYAAFRDCQTTLLLDPNHVKAHFRLAKCLHDLSRNLEAHKVLEDFKIKFPEYCSNSSHRALKRDIKEELTLSDDEDRRRAEIQLPRSQLSSREKEWRLNPLDYKLRFCGHCNTTTDIKEANFFGNNGQYIVAGSDDGSFFIWDRYTTNIVRVLKGDDRIVNCLQPHPSTCLLATSGIDPVIRLWSPLPEDGRTNDREVSNLYEAAMANQDRMNCDPFELMMMSMGYQFPGGHMSVDDDDSEEHEETLRPAIDTAGCRTS